MADYVLRADPGKVGDRKKLILNQLQLYKGNIVLSGELPYFTCEPIEAGYLARLARPTNPHLANEVQKGSCVLDAFQLQVLIELVQADHDRTSGKIT